MAERTSRLVGLALCAIGIVATLCLAATGRLEMYIHPRYTVFTVVLAVLGAIGLLLALWFGRDALFGRGGDGHDDHDHDHEDAPADTGASDGPAARRTVRVGALAGGALVVVAGLALIVVPPTTLSTQRAAAAGVSTSATSADEPVLIGSDSRSFTIKDWAALLAGGAGASDLAAQRADITGFVLRDDSGYDDVVYLARYQITCCIVDAQVVAVPVRAGAWSEGLSDGDWMRVTGSFSDLAESSVMTVLVPDETETAAIPDDPYVF